MLEEAGVLLFFSLGIEGRVFLRVLYGRVGYVVEELFFRYVGFFYSCWGVLFDGGKLRGVFFCVLGSFCFSLLGFFVVGGIW